ncbi:hypothetical protein [Halocatena marina]|uniref:Uncharacterized protein n=1 Tax=Halocatena marina TaxID=2934937 RepID=A0ABD5YH35_9EURY|nr:hypothetical protein [Halocatena marina]
MRRSTLIGLGYAGFGVLFLANAVTGNWIQSGSCDYIQQQLFVNVVSGSWTQSISCANIRRRMITWGVLGGIWLLVSVFALLRPEQFENKGDTTEIGYGAMFSAVFVVLLVLSGGVLINVILSLIYMVF